MRNCLILICLVSAIESAHAQDLREEPGLDTRFQEDQRLETETALGRITVGVSGLSENEKLDATIGDVELGYLYQFEFDTTFPRVAELRPFLFNRAESTGASYYESLGIGAGLRLNWRKKYEENNWFIRFTVLTPTDAYRERYDLDRNQSSIIELFSGYEIPFSDLYQGREMRQRITPPSMIQLAVPPELFDPNQQIDSAVLKRVHTLIIGAYLTRVQEQLTTIDTQSPIADRNWPAIDLIQQVTQEDFPEAKWRSLHIDVIQDEDELAKQRRELVAQYLRQGLIEMMRGPYALLLKPTKSQPGEKFSPVLNNTPVGQISYPGIRLKPSQQPLDADTMIEDYIALMTSQIR
ncbi:MAG: hypothetical protein AB8C95_13065 [Phycisphaeraceae bacterium]